MASPFLQCRVDTETRERAERAAAECDMAVGTWLKAIVVGALEAHEDVELVESETHPGEYYEVRRGQGTCTCLGFAHSGSCKHLALPEEEEQPLDTEYVRRIEEEAAEAREAIDPPPAVEHPGSPDPGPRSDEPERLNPRDCPHLPQWRGATGRCSRCGGGARPSMRLGARLTR